ncbi:MAG: ABC transporter ATP-binding protein [Bacteroidales bacterium]
MILQVEGVSKSYASLKALDNVSLSIPEGVIYGLLGPNGAGKTTLIRLINRITMPDEGTIYLNGNSLSSDDISYIGYLPEERGLYKKMKVKEQIHYFGQLKGLSHYDVRAKAKDWLERFEVSHLADKKVEELSKGMQQKIQIICTILHNPKLLIFDEPFSGFDPVNAQLLKREILRLRDEGSTFLLSTHNMNSVEELCSDISLINHSKVVLQGSVRDIRHENKSDILSITLQDKEINLDSSRVEVLERNIISSGVAQLRVKKLHTESNSTLLSSLLPQAEIYSFYEELPSMEDVFVKTVTMKK